MVTCNIDDMRETGNESVEKVAPDEETQVSVGGNASLTFRVEGDTRARIDRILYEHRRRYGPGMTISVLVERILIGLIDDIGIPPASRPKDTTVCVRVPTYLAKAVKERAARESVRVSTIMQTVLRAGVMEVEAQLGLSGPPNA